MKKLFNQLFKDSVVYGVGGVLSKAIGVILVPIYTRIFTPAEFGVLEFLITITTFVSLIMQLGLNGAQSFFFFKQKNEGKFAQSKIISSIVQIKLLWGGFILIVATVLSPLISYFFFNGKLTLIYFLVAFSSALFQEVMIQAAQVFRLIYKPWKYLFITFFKTISASSIALTLIIISKQGILGYFYGMLFGALFAMVFGWFLIREFIVFEFIKYEWLVRLLKFSLPLVPLEIVNYVLKTSDRWFIIKFCSEYDLGLYAAGAKIALVLNLVINTFRMSWWPIGLDAMQQEGGNKFFKTIANIYVTIAVSSIVFLVSIAKPLVHFIFPGEYNNSYIIVTALAWYVVFHGYFMIGAAGIWKSEKTIYNAISISIGAVINIILNYILVPKYGGIGAAVATSISYFIWTSVGIFISEMFWKIGINYLRIGLQIFLGICATYILYTIDVNNYSYFYKILCTFLLLLLVALIFLTKEMRKYIYQFIKSIYSRN